MEDSLSYLDNLLMMHDQMVLRVYSSETTSQVLTRTGFGQAVK